MKTLSLFFRHEPIWFDTRDDNTKSIFKIVSSKTFSSYFIFFCVLLHVEKKSARKYKYSGVVYKSIAKTLGYIIFSSCTFD